MLFPVVSNSNHVIFDFLLGCTRYAGQERSPHHTRPLESRDKHGIYKYFVLPFKTKQVACKLPETARTRLFIGMYHDARNGLEKLLSLTVSLQSTTIIG